MAWLLVGVPHMGGSLGAGSHLWGSGGWGPDFGAELSNCMMCKRSAAGTHDDMVLEATAGFTPQHSTAQQESGVYAPPPCIAQGGGAGIPCIKATQTNKQQRAGSTGGDPKRQASKEEQGTDVAVLTMSTATFYPQLCKTTLRCVANAQLLLLLHYWQHTAETVTTNTPQGLTIGG